jgi:hypothetical protein
LRRTRCEVLQQESKSQAICRRGFGLESITADLDCTFGKWSPNWEGHFRVVRCTPGNAYILKTLLGEEFTAAINGRYLKKYYSSIEVDR